MKPQIVNNSNNSEINQAVKEYYQTNPNNSYEEIAKQFGISKHTAKKITDEIFVRFSK